MGKAVALAIGKKAIVVDLHGLEVNLYVLFEETAEFWFDLFVLSSSKLAGHRRTLIAPCDRMGCMDAP